MMPRMTKNMSGLEKAGLFSGGGVGDSMVVGCKKNDTCNVFSWCGLDAFLRGFLRKDGPGLWFYRGEIVVDCMVNVVRR
jgi:hypothetical protein